MAEKDSLKTLQQLVGKHNPKDKAVQKVFGLSARNMELVWAVFDAVDESLAISDLTKLAKATLDTKFPSPYINNLRAAGVIKNGGRGKWSVSMKAIEKALDILEGKAGVGETESSTSGKKKVAKQPGRKKGKKSGRPSARKSSSALPPSIAKKTLGDIVESLKKRGSEIAEEIKQLRAEKKAIPKKIRELVAFFRKE